MWNSEEWTAIGTVAGAAGALGAAVAAAYTAVQAKHAAESSSEVARQAARGLALHEMPKANGMVTKNVDADWVTQVSVHETVTGVLILRRHGVEQRRINFSGRNSGWHETHDADAVEVEFTDESGRRWRWLYPVADGVEVESDPQTSMTYKPLELLEP